MTSETVCSQLPQSRQHLGQRFTARNTPRKPHSTNCGAMLGKETRKVNTFFQAILKVAVLTLRSMERIVQCAPESAGRLPSLRAALHASTAIEMILHNCYQYPRAWLRGRSRGISCACSCSLCALYPYSLPRIPRHKKVNYLAQRRLWKTSCPHSSFRIT